MPHCWRKVIMYLIPWSGLYLGLWHLTTINDYSFCCSAFMWCRLLSDEWSPPLFFRISPPWAGEFWELWVLSPNLSRVSSVIIFWLLASFSYRGGGGDLIFTFHGYWLLFSITNGHCFLFLPLEKILVILLLSVMNFKTLFVSIPCQKVLLFLQNVVVSAFGIALTVWF